MVDERTSPPQERAIRGLTWAIRGLIGFLGVALATAAVLVAFIPLYDLPSPSHAETLRLEDGLLVLSWVLLALGVASGLVYAVGLAGLYGNRRELGTEHAKSVEQTVPWLAVTMVLLAAGILIPSPTGPFLTFPGIGPTPPDWAGSLSVVLAGLRAIFAGLTLYYAVQGLAMEDARVRLLIGMSLGVAGAVLWTGLATFAAGAGVLSVDSLLPFLAGIVAGLGTSAISIALFIAVYREIRDGLVEGRRPGA